MKENKDENIEVCTKMRFKISSQVCVNLLFLAVILMAVILASVVQELVK